LSGSVIELNSNEGIKINTDKGRVRQFTRYIEERDACSACYGSLIHALDRMQGSGQLNRVKSKFYIGQHYKGKILDTGTGIGNCARGCPDYVPRLPRQRQGIYSDIFKKI